MMTLEEIKIEISTYEKLYKNSQYYEAIALANELLANSVIQDEVDVLATVNNFLGIVYNRLSDYPKALEYFSKALQLFEEIGIKVGIGGNLVNIGLIYSSIKKYDTAFEYFSKALIILEEIGHKEFQANATSNIGLVYNNLSDYPKALEYYSKALQINEEIENKVGIASNLGNIGEVYLRLLDYPKALEYSTISLGINEEINNKFSMALNFGNIGIVYASKESLYYNVVIAEEYLQKTLLISNEIGAKDFIRESYEQLHTLRLTEGRFEEALEYYKKSVEIEKEIQSEEAKNQALIFDQRRKLEEDEKARQLKLARFQEQEKILHNILPVKIADRILNQDTFIADHFESVSVMFMDIVGFTSLSSIAPPKQLVYLLDAIFQKADEVVENYGLEKIKTIGDGYLAVANVTSPLEHHQKPTAQAALQLLETMRDFVVNIPSDLGDTDWIKDMNDLEIRIGIHTGEVVAGIIGKNKYTYDLWGDAVNVASRMESNSEPGRIHISEEFAKSIESYTEFSLIPRGTINIKGKGTMNTFWLEKGKI